MSRIELLLAAIPAVLPVLLVLAQIARGLLRILRSIERLTLALQGLSTTVHDHITRSDARTEQLAVRVTAAEMALAVHNAAHNGGHHQ